MNKFNLLFILFGFFTLGYSQEISENVLGLRLGDNEGFGAEVSYQRHMKDDNRLELDLGLRSNRDYNSFKISGLYQWVWNIDGDFNWYAGVGGGIGRYSYDANLKEEKGTFLVASGDVGVEYLFNQIPLQLSLDLRPELYFGGHFREDNFGPDIALGIRYRF